ncbi:hypothetical protein GJ496_009616 [Pomphorhynchus laevis]|nr:hypothetical protein GJ496_009616 [Pomphorhynchus laevis]
MPRKTVKPAANTAVNKKTGDTNDTDNSNSTDDELNPRDSIAFKATKLARKGTMETTAEEGQRYLKRVWGATKTNKVGKIIERRLSKIRKMNEERVTKKPKIEQPENTVGKQATVVLPVEEALECAKTDPTNDGESTTASCHESNDYEIEHVLVEKLPSTKKIFVRNIGIQVSCNRIGKHIQTDSN